MTVTEIPHIADLSLYLNRSEPDQNIICSLTNQRGTILYVNEGFCQISGYEENELIGAKHSIINSNFHGRDFFKEMWRTIGKGHIWQGEIRNKTKSGSFYWVDTIIFPVYSSTHKEKQYFSVRTLINDKKKMETERQDRLKELQDILFKISHGLRQPVTQLLGMMQILNDTENFNRDEIAEVARHVLPSIKKLDHYTRELTHYIIDVSKKEDL